MSTEHLLHRLFETTIDYNGNEVNGFDSDLASEVRTAWFKKYGSDIEESLDISGCDVSRIFELVPEILIRWAFDEEANGE